MGVLADTVRRLTNQLLDATLISQPVRLRRILLRLHRHYDDGRIALTHDDLAEMLGAQRTTVTELLAAEAAAGRSSRAAATSRSSTWRRCAQPRAEVPPRDVRDALTMPAAGRGTSMRIRPPVRTARGRPGARGHGVRIRRRGRWVGGIRGI